MRVMVVVLFCVAGFAVGLMVRSNPPSTGPEIGSVEALIDDLRSGDLSHRVRAAQEIRSLTGLNFDYNPFGSEEEIEAGWRRWVSWWQKARNKTPHQWLSDALLDKAYRHRSEVALRIGVRGYRGCIPALILSLKDDDPRVRAACATSLARLRAKNAIPHLVALLDDPEPSVSTAATLALTRFGKEGVSILLKNIDSVTNPVSLQTIADTLLAHNLNAESALRRLLNADDHSKLFALDRIRRCRISALKKDVLRLSQNSSPPVKKAAQKTLAVLGEK